MGKYARSLTLFQQALEIGRTLEMPGQLQATLNNLAITYLLLNQDEQAIQLLEPALAHFEGVGAQSIVVTIRQNLGVAYESLGNFEAAERHLEQALYICRTVGNPYRLAQTLAHLGALRNRQGRSAEGLELLEESLKLSKRIGDREGTGLSLSLLGVIHEALGDEERALACYQASLVVQASISDIEGMRATFYNLGRFHEDVLGRLDLARRCYQRAVTLLERSRAGLERRSHRLTYTSDKLRVYHHLALLEWRSENPTPAWEMTERARSRGLLDLLASLSLAPPPAVNPRDRQEESNLLAQLRGLLYTRSVTEDIDESLTLESQLGTIEAELDGVWEAMSAVAPGYVALRRGEPLSLPAVRELLGL